MIIHDNPIYSPTELFTHIKMLLHSNFSHITIEGEVEGLKTAKMGQVYFDLKDDESSISCVCWPNNLNQVMDRPQEGNMVSISGYISTYKKRSVYQINVLDCQLIENTGKALDSKNKLIKELESLGYFKDSNKKPIPKIINRIALITSKSGAVMHDIINTISQRRSLSILLHDVKVQGTSAKEIVHAIKNIEEVNKSKKIDAIIIARGGGSAGDIEIFNERPLLDSIFKCKIPIISAIGHETDSPLCDFVADYRASTPTAAAVAVTYLTKDVMLSNINNALEAITNVVKQTIKYKKHEINQLNNLQVAKQQIKFYKDQISTQEISNKQNLKHITLNRKKASDAIMQQITNQMNLKIKELNNKLTIISTKVIDLSPFSILSKGYKIIYDNKDNIVMHNSSIQSGNIYKVQSSDSTETFQFNKISKKN